MARVTVKVNGRTYEVACEDGQEEHILSLASYVDEKVQQLVAEVGQVGEPRLLVMSAILIADELHDAYVRLDNLDDGKLPPGKARADSAAAALLEGFAQRIDAIAARIEAA